MASRPLNATWNQINPGRNIIGLKHWAVVLSNSVLPSESCKGMTLAEGITFLELKRDHKLARYEISWGKMDAMDIKWNYIDITTLSEDQIESRGIQFM